MLTQYDLENIKIRLKDHKYILSRFLIARQLTQTLIPDVDASRIASHLKKRLIDENKRQLTQPELEQRLFDMMRLEGFGRVYADRFLVLQAFHQRRYPLLILISGIDGIGKSSSATVLAERLNLPHVIQSTTLVDLMQHLGPHRPAIPSVVPGAAPDEVIAVFREQAGVVRTALEADITRAVDNGKSLIVEGPHLDPALYTGLTGRAPAAVVPFVMRVGDDRFRQMIRLLPSNGRPELVEASLLIQEELCRTACRLGIKTISVDGRTESDIVTEMQLHVLQAIERFVGDSLDVHD